MHKTEKERMCACRYLLLMLVMCSYSNWSRGGEPHRLMTGVIADEYVFSAGFLNGVTVEPTGCGFVAVVRARLDGRGKTATRSLPQVVATDDAAPVFLRWRMDKGAFLNIDFWALPSGSGRKYGGISRLPADVLSALDPNFGVGNPKPYLGTFDLQGVAGLYPLALAYEAASLARERGRRNVISAFFDESYDEVLEHVAGRKPTVLQLFVRQAKACVRKQILPLLDICDLVESSCKTMPYAHYDFVPGPKDDCTLFIRNAGSMVRWEYRNEVAKDQGNRIEDWSVKESWKVDWSEPFYVHRQGTTYFLVTESGKVYSAKDAANGGDGTAKRLQLATQPVVALVWNWTGDRAFAFGRDFFFELKEDAKLISCDDIRGVGKDMEQALSTIVNCARVLRKEGILRR